MHCGNFKQFWQWDNQHFWLHDYQKRDFERLISSRSPHISARYLVSADHQADDIIDELVEFLELVRKHSCENSGEAIWKP